MKKRFFLIAVFVLSLFGSLFVQAQEARSPLFDSWEEYLKLKKESTFGLEWISLGPVMNSARVESVQCDPSNPGTMYVAFGSGNLWKTTNNGLTWKQTYHLNLLMNGKNWLVKKMRK